MSQTFGLSAAGFQPMQQQDIINAIIQQLNAAVGTNINTTAQSIFGQLIGIFSEREALIWQLAQAVYASQYPAGAEGSSVDNILALNGLKRLPATATHTAPNENGQIGLKFFGTPGTVIPAGSLISIMGQPQNQFSVDLSVTIAAAISAMQSIFFSSVPNQGLFTVSIADPAGNTLTTESLPFNMLADQSQLLFTTTPSSGAFTVTLTAAGAPLTTASIPFTANAAAVQAAINALAGYSGVTVTGSFAAGFVITWGAIANPLVTFSSTLVGATMSSLDSVQAAVNNLHDIVAANYPYTDVTITGSYTTGFTVIFGALSPIGSNPASGNQAQALFTVVTNTLLTGATVVNINVVSTQAGSVPLGIGSATCTQTGPIPAAAGTLTVIDTPVTGWAAVTNPLDAILGTNLEDDTDALARRLTLLNATANGPLQAIVQRVREVAAVITAIGFENLLDTVVDGRPGHSFEIVVEGGDDTDIANAIYASKPAGIQTDGTTSVTVTDANGFTHQINFSRPTIVPIFVIINLQTNADFPANGAQLIQSEIIAIGNAFPIGGLIIGFGSNGLIGAFNNVPGILSYTLFFGIAPNPSTNTNIQLTAEELAEFETFNVIVEIS